MSSLSELTADAVASLAEDVINEAKLADKKELISIGIFLGMGAAYRTVANHDSSDIGQSARLSAISMEQRATNLLDSVRLRKNN